MLCLTNTADHFKAVSLLSTETSFSLLIRRVRTEGQEAMVIRATKEHVVKMEKKAQEAQG